MKNKYTIYITFPDELEQNNNVLFNQIRDYIAHLDLMTQRQLNQKLNFVIKDIDFNASNFESTLNGSACALVFIHPDFIADERYQIELESICKQFDLENFEPIDQPQKVFKLCLEPLQNTINPQQIEKLLPYNFYERNTFSRKIKNLEFENEKGSAVLYLKLLDLVYAINLLFQPVSENEVSEDPQKCIFLGYSTFDQQESMDEIRRELQAIGIKVLPLVNQPETHDELEKLIISNLEKSSASIQLMGQHYGDTLKGTKYSLIEFQNKIIKDYQETHQSHQILRFIWIPVLTKINDQRQILYLKRLKRDDANINSEIIESPIETFKTFLIHRLEQEQIQLVDSFENGRNVYLLSEKEISLKSDKLYAALSTAGLRVITLDLSEQTGIYARHLKALRKCDIIIVYQKNENPFWLNSKLRDLVKAPGIGRQYPFKKIIVISTSTVDRELTSAMNPKPEIISNVDVDSDFVLQKLNAE